MSTIIGNVFYFLVLLSILVVAHELGHFLTAKFLGIGVEIFSIGFGPRILGFRRKGTDYRISAVPIGGYVKLKGEETSTGAPDEYLSRPKGQRFLVLFMGPMMNLLVAVLVMTGVYMAGLEEPKYLSQPVVVGWVEPGSAADKAGIKPGDQILQIDDQKNPTWRDLRVIVSTRAGHPVRVKVKRGEQLFDTLLIPQKRTRYELGYSGIYVPTHPVIGQLIPGQPAEKAGLKRGDRIIRVNGEEVKDFFHLRDIISASAGKELTLTVKRGDKVFNVKITPVEREGRGIIGFFPYEETIKIKVSLPKAFYLSLKENLYYLKLTVDVIGRLITGKISARTLSGPLDIAQFSYMTASAGAIPFLAFLAFVSLQLAVINLLPIPALDGGHIFIILIEVLIRRDLSERTKEWILRIGFYLIILLSVFVIVNDILKRI